MLQKYDSSFGFDKGVIMHQKYDSSFGFDMGVILHQKYDFSFGFDMGVILQNKYDISFGFVSRDFLHLKYDVSFEFDLGVIFYQNTIFHLHQIWLSFSTKNSFISFIFYHFYVIACIRSLICVIAWIVMRAWCVKPIDNEHDFLKAF